MGDSHRWFRRLLSALFCLFVLVGSGWAQSWTEGLGDKEIYADRVSFVVPSAAGYETTATLNGTAIEIDTQITVEQPDYYELAVNRRDLASGQEQSELIQFIIRDSRRGTSEQGLRTWTPYPQTASAAAEFTDTHLRIVMPSVFPLGLEIPVIARVENEAGIRLGVNGAIAVAEFPDHPLQLLRGVGSVFLPAATEPGVLTWTGQIQTLQAFRAITIEADTDWQEVSGTIDTDTDWGTNARIRIRGDVDNPLTVAVGTTLTIGAGSIVVVDPDTSIVIEGNIAVGGTLEEPVVFTSANRQVPWGGFLFESGGTQGTFAGTILTASGADSDWLNHHPGYGSSHRAEQCLFFLANGAELTLTDCYLVENHGQAGHGESAELTMTRCLVQKCVTTGQYNRGSVVLDDCALIEFPSADSPFLDEDNDGLYITGGAHFLTNCLIGWALDDGVDAGSGAAGSVTVENCWFESCYHEGMAWSESRDARTSDTVAINCGQGIECGFGSPDVNAVHCLSTANLIGARFGDCYDWNYGGFLNVRDSLLLFNYRDVWGRAWDDWTVHVDQMNVRDNYLSTPNPNVPDNAIWTPQDDPNQTALLEPFRPTSGAAVGVGLAVAKDSLDVERLADSLPVRLSTFTTGDVSVNYTVETDAGLVDSGLLHFVPGQTVRQIVLDPVALADAPEIRVTLSDPVNAELTGISQVTYRNMAAFVEPLVVTGDPWTYFKGTKEPPADWNTLAFDDADWPVGPTPIGYETSSGYEGCIATALDDMPGNYLTVYARCQFTVADPAQLIGLALTMNVDDGYIAYLNGIPVARENASEASAYDDVATGSHEACCGTCDLQSLDLTDHLADLVSGVNVLAVQVHNRSLTSSDLLLDAELTATTGP